MSAAINNETDEAMFMDLQLHLGSLDLSAQTNPTVTIHLLESCDGGTTYEQATDATTDNDLQPPDAPDAIMAVRVGTAGEVKESVVSMIPIPPGYFKICLTNETNVQFAATGNTLKYRTYKATVA